MNKEVFNFETPFSDVFVQREEPGSNGSSENISPASSFETPFLKTFETAEGQTIQNPFAQETAGLLSELEDHEFTRNLYDLASELEDTWLPLITHETALEENFIPFATRQAADYFRPLIKAGDRMFDRISRNLSHEHFTSLSESEQDTVLDEFRPDSEGLTPVQEQFLGSVFKKVKGAVKAGIKAVGKILPVNIILGKLKGLIKPLLDRVLKFAIGKLPKNLQPYAQTLSGKIKLEVTGEDVISSETIASSGDIDGIQTEFDGEIAQLVFAPDETEAEWFIKEYETGIAEDEDFTGTSIEPARRQLITELSELGPGESPAPAIERFLPAVMALRPVIKMGISVIGRPKIIKFLAGLLAKLVEKYVPRNVVQPLASSIIDTGMKAIGFETPETKGPEAGYEALVNTIEDTVRNLNPTSEAEAGDEEELTLQLLEAFENAAVNNFPSQYIKEELRKTVQPGVWVLKPRGDTRRSYKKYTTIFTAAIDPEKARTILTFRDLPLANFLRDKLGLDPSKTVQAKVHLFESIPGTKLNQINKHENLKGLNSSIKYSWIQLHPLTKQAASVLLNEPGLGKDFPKKFTMRRQQIAVGQRFYYLEIEGANLRRGNQPGVNRPAHSDDVRGTIDFIKSTVSINYYFSEEQSKTIVEKLNTNDFTGALIGVKSSVKGVLRQMLTGNLSGKVKIVHETFPYMYVDKFTEGEGGIRGVAKGILTGVLENVVRIITEKAFEGLRDFMRTRSAEFRKAQAEPEDGLTLIISWNNVAGLSGLKSLITGISTGQLINPAMIRDLKPGTPEIRVIAGKKFQ